MDSIAHLSALAGFCINIWAVALWSFQVGGGGNGMKRRKNIGGRITDVGIAHAPIDEVTKEEGVEV